MCDRERETVPRLEKRGGYRGGDGPRLGPPAKVPSGLSTVVEATEKKPRPKAS
jgi:hypothetical protein